MNNLQQQQLLLSEINKEINNIDYCWHQGPTAFEEAQKSAKKVFELLKLMKGSLYSTKEILKIMIKRLSHLNKMSYWKLKILLGEDL
jgi:hypothetical protein